MEVVIPIVGGKSMCFSIQCKRPLRYPVSISSDDSSEVRIVIQVFLQTVVSQDDITRIAILIGCPDLCNDPSVVGDLHGDIVLVGQGVKEHLFVINKAKW